MLDPCKQRLDYGEQLRPPPRHVLHFAVATSYSLDLDALMAATLALALDQTLEGDGEDIPLALLESLDRLRDRLLVFYQSGRIAAPPRYNRLYTLLEPLTVPVPAASAFGAFHPKLWLLHYKPLDTRGAEHFRLLVLSRNLTFDRSWDLAACIDGTLAQRGNTDPALLAFLQSLPAAGRDAHLQSLCNALTQVQWALPQQFSALRFLHGAAGASAPLALQGQIDELLVVSPFLNAGEGSLLRSLQRRCHSAAARTLISRADTLDRVGAAALEGWRCLSVPSGIVNGEDKLEQKQPRPQDLHAKLIVARQGETAVWHIGSANMTNAAFGCGNGAPRNTEVMLRLQGETAVAGPTLLLQQWTQAGIFVAHEFGDAPELDPQQGRVLRQLVHALSSANWVQAVSSDGGAAFQLDLSVDSPPLLPPEHAVSVSPLALPAPQPLAASLRWTGLALSDLSAYIRIEITLAQTTHAFAVQTRFAADLPAGRRSAVFNALVDSPDKVLHYLRLILDTGAVKSGGGCGGGEGAAIDLFDADGPEGLYEQLLRAAAREPQRVIRALEVFQRLQQGGAQLPENLETLLCGFASLAAEPGHA